MNNARSFIKKLVIILLVLILADQLIGRWLARSFARITDSDIGSMNHAIDSTTAPVLILGSSRALHNYASPILRDSLHVDCYNAGLDKQNLAYPMAILAAIFQRYHPQTIILDLKPDAFTVPEKDLSQLGILLPFYNTHPEIQPILNKRNRWQRWKTLSFFYCYKSLTPQIIAHSIIGDTEKDSVSQGYIPIFETLLTTPDTIFHEDRLSMTPDTTPIDVFENIISLAQQNHCRLIVVVSPLYYSLKPGSTTIQTAVEICRAKHVPFLDYSSAAGFANQNSLFSDATHLNDSGARKFTRVLAAALHNSE